VSGAEAEDGERFRRRSSALVALATVLSLGHHLDHVVRGDHSGWPATDQLTMFTGSLVVYPLLVVGVVLTRTGRAGPRYWMAFSGSGALFLAAVHAGPAAIEPRADIVGGHSTALLGWLAYGWLLALVAVLLGHVVLCVAWWQTADRTGPAPPKRSWTPSPRSSGC